MKEFLSEAFFETAGGYLTYGRVAVAAFFVLALRYFAVVGAFHWYFWKRGSERWIARRVYAHEAGGEQVLSEVLWSVVTCAAYALMIAFIYYAWERGWTLIYIDPTRYGWGYLVGSFGLVMLFHETYFYWVHRLMHVEPLYRHVHRIHHQFVQPGPWAAFSFHPLEVVTEHLVLPVLVFLIPLHPIVISAYLLLMTVSGVINHLGVEIFPRKGRSIGRWLISATHHAQHHRLYRYNYGLYFTFWDRIVGTQHPDFDRDFQKER